MKWEELRIFQKLVKHRARRKRCKRKEWKVLGAKSRVKMLFQEQRKAP